MLVAALFIEHGRDPAWERADDYIRTLSRGDLVDAIREMNKEAEEFARENPEDAEALDEGLPYTAQDELEAGQGYLAEDLDHFEGRVSECLSSGDYLRLDRFAVFLLYEEELESEGQGEVNRAARLNDLRVLEQADIGFAGQPAARFGPRG